MLDPLPIGQPDKRQGFLIASRLKCEGCGRTFEYKYGDVVLSVDWQSIDEIGLCLECK